MEQWDTESTWGRIRCFTDRHIRVFTITLCLAGIPAAILFLLPSALVATADPVDNTAIRSPPPSLSLTFLDKAGAVIGRQGPVAGLYVGLNQLPAYVPKAFLAMEDRRFFSHHGVDFLGLSRAAYSNLRAGRIVAGGSTISQQTAKLLFTDGSRTFGRKLHELVNTASLEKSFTKSRILEIYLNRIYLGQGAFGVDTAARTYFGIPAAQLTVSQAALLAGLTRAPTLYSPRRNPALARKRTVLALAAMVETGAITQAQADEARAHPAAIIPGHRDDHNYVLDAGAGEAQRLISENNITASALIVHTTVDSALQAQVQTAVERTIRRLGPKLGFSQAALVLMSTDGAISAMVGGVDYSASVFNRVTQAHRQPGSAFKPFVYLAGLEHGISPWDWREDEVVEISGYRPANYRDASYGRLRLIDALARSVNSIAVNLGQEVGLRNVIAAAVRLGIKSPLHNNASLALGTDEVTPLELTAAYGAFANGGKVISPYMVSTLENAGGGSIVFQRMEVQTNPVISDEVRRGMSTMLLNVVEAGTGTAARLPARDAGGKTGTTQDYRDAWFVGFTAAHVAGVWVGNDDNSPMRKVTGGTVPALLWKAAIMAAEAHSLPLALERLPGPPVGTESEEVSATAFVDDPMPGSTFVDPGISRGPELANVETSPAPAPVRVQSGAIESHPMVPTLAQTPAERPAMQTPSGQISRLQDGHYLPEDSAQTAALSSAPPANTPPDRQNRDYVFAPARRDASPNWADADRSYSRQSDREHRSWRERGPSFPDEEDATRNRDFEGPAWRYGPPPERYSPYRERLQSAYPGDR